MRKLFMVFVFLMLLFLPCPGESNEVTVEAVNGYGILKNLNKQNVNVTFYGIRSRVLYKLAENFYITGEGSLLIPEKANFSDGKARFTIEPTVTSAELSITLEGDDNVMFTVGPMFRYTRIPVDAIALSDPAITGHGKVSIEDWFAVESMRFRGQSGPHRIELRGSVYIPISWKRHSNLKVYKNGNLIEVTDEKDSGSGNMGGKIELTYGYKMVTVSTGYEYMSITNKSGMNLFTLTAGVTF
jgi:hypothetical protein